ncbi:MAG: ThiF family adenylyltransferase [Candidatus Cloacimonetes bacterium]|nr:ThiF family adenylyltransferase [Candidatus Cloacimonadota bacterium]
MSSNDIFSRHALFLGEEKLRLLRNSTILVAGVGGLGSVVCDILYRSGIGKLILVDNNKVDLPDLNRQSLFTALDIGKYKVIAAAERLSEIHTLTELVTFQIDITDQKALSVLKDEHRFAGIADCLDNYHSRFALEKMVERDVFLVHGGVRNDFGQVTTINKGRSLQTLYKGEKDFAESIPVMPQIVKIIGSIMTQEIMNNIFWEPLLVDKLVIFELSDFSLFKLDIDLRIEVK